jgi:hypothetical protein
MSLGPAVVTLTTALPVDEVVTELRARGEPPLYDLVPCTDVPEAGTARWPRLLHCLGSGLSGAVWDPGEATLTVSAGFGDLSAEGLMFTGCLLLESQLHRRGYLTLHAAAACRQGRAVLPLGSAGAGKTTTLLRRASITRAMPDLLGLFPGEIADSWRGG